MMQTGRKGDRMLKMDKKGLGLFIYLLKAYSPVNRTGSPQGFSLNQFIYLLKAYSPASRTGTPAQGFSLDQILHKLKTIQNMNILQT